MCDTVMDNRVQLLQARGQALEHELVTYWKPEDTRRALEVYDFEDFLGSGVKHWQSLCHFNDALREHVHSCKHDHQHFFDELESAFKSFRSRAKFVIEHVLPTYESEYDVKNANEIRQALRDVETLLTPVDIPDGFETL